MPLDSEIINHTVYKEGKLKEKENCIKYIKRIQKILNLLTHLCIIAS